jgi:hypothetical protein
MHFQNFPNDFQEYEQETPENDRQYPLNQGQQMYHRVGNMARGSFNNQMVGGRP